MSFFSILLGVRRPARRLITRLRGLLHGLDSFRRAQQRLGLDAAHGTAGCGDWRLAAVLRSRPGDSAGRREFSQQSAEHGRRVHSAARYCMPGLVRRRGIFRRRSRMDNPPHARDQRLSLKRHGKIRSAGGRQNVRRENVSAGSRKLRAAYGVATTRTDSETRCPPSCSSSRRTLTSLVTGR